MLLTTPVAYSRVLPTHRHTHHDRAQSTWVTQMCTHCPAPTSALGSLCSWQHTSICFCQALFRQARLFLFWCLWHLLTPWKTTPTREGRGHWKGVADSRTRQRQGWDANWLLIMSARVRAADPCKACHFQPFPWRLPLAAKQQTELQGGRGWKTMSYWSWLQTSRVLSTISTVKLTMATGHTHAWL